MYTSLFVGCQLSCGRRSLPINLNKIQIDSNLISAVYSDSMAKKPAKKATNIEIDKRVHRVYDLLLRGHNKTQIVRYCAENFKVSLRQTETYLERARVLQSIDCEMERPQFLLAAIARLQDYERRASEDNNLVVAMKSLELQAKLLRFEMSV